MYSNAVLNVFNNPKNTGRISKPDGIADLCNEEGTAHVEFSLRIENGIIKNCQFRAQANPYFVAICSTITHMVKGKMISGIFIDPYSVKKELGDESDFDIDFCIDCFRLAIEDYKEKLEKEKKGSKSSKSENPEVQEELAEENLEKVIEEKDEFDFDDFDFLGYDDEDND